MSSKTDNSSSNIKDAAVRDEVLDFQHWLSDTNKQLMSREEAAEEGCLEDKINENQQLENEIQQYEVKLRELTDKGEPQTPAISTKLSLLQTNWEDLQKHVNLKRQQLNKAKIIQFDPRLTKIHLMYHKIIKDYMEFLDTAEQKLKTENIMATDATDLAQQLEKHMEFFVDLDMHHMMIETIAQKADTYTQHLFTSQRAMLDKQSGALQVKATSRGHQMEKLVSEWKQFEKNMKELRSWVGHVEMQLPSNISDETQENIQKGINKYQAMKTLLTERKSNLQQSLSRGKDILKYVNSPPLEHKLTNLTEKWQDMENGLAHDLDRLSQLMDDWKAFDKESIEFLPWLARAMEQLSTWNNPDEGDKELEPVAVRMEKFMEFRKDVENHAPLQASVCNHGHQLIKVKQLNSTPIRERLTLIENRWADIQHDLPMLQEELHQLQDTYEDHLPSSSVETTEETMDAKEEQVTSSDINTTTPPPREKLIESAVKFLLNQQVRNSSLSQKRAFLLKKGLTSEELDIAVDRSGTKEVPPNQPPRETLYNQQMVPYQPPVVKSRYERWRDYTAMAVVISGVSYGFYKLYEKLLQPLITSRQEEKERQERLERSIQELSTSVKEAVVEMQKSLTSINTLMEQQQVQFNQMMLDDARNRSGSRSAETAELKTEISSLKGLLLNRHQFPATPQPTPIPAWQRAPVTQEATPTKVSPTNKQTSPRPNPPITGIYDEIDRTLDGNTLSNSSESDNDDDALANSCIDNEDTSLLSHANGQGKSGGSHDNLNQLVNQNESIDHNEDAGVDVEDDEH